LDCEITTFGVDSTNIVKGTTGMFSTRPHFQKCPTSWFFGPFCFFLKFNVHTDLILARSLLAMIMNTSEANTMDDETLTKALSVGDSHLIIA